MFLTFGILFARQPFRALQLADFANACHCAMYTGWSIKHVTQKEILSSRDRLGSVLRCS